MQGDDYRLEREKDMRGGVTRDGQRAHRVFAKRPGKTCAAEGRLRSVIGRPGCNFTPIIRDLNVGVEAWQSGIRRTMRTPRSCSWRDRNFEDTVTLI